MDHVKHPEVFISLREKKNRNATFYEAEWCVNGKKNLAYGALRGFLLNHLNLNLYDASLLHIFFYPVLTPESCTDQHWKKLLFTLKNNMLT